LLELADRGPKAQLEQALEEQKESRLLCGKGAARTWKGRLLRERSEEEWLRALAKL
jgi:hypothetical protein